MRLVRCLKCRHVWACTDGGKTTFCRTCKKACEFKATKLEDALNYKLINFDCPNCSRVR